MLDLAKNHVVTFCDQRGSSEPLNTFLTKDIIYLDQFVADSEVLHISLSYEKFIIIGFSWGSAQL